MPIHYTLQVCRKAHAQIGETLFTPLLFPLELLLSFVIDSSEACPT
jgi:hypothetical protein